MDDDPDDRDSYGTTTTAERKDENENVEVLRSLWLSLGSQLSHVSFPGDVCVCLAAVRHQMKMTAERRRAPNHRKKYHNLLLYSLTKARVTLAIPQSRF